MAWSGVRSGAQDGTSDVRIGAQADTRDERSGAQVRLPARLQLPAKPSNSTGSAPISFCSCRAGLDAVEDDLRDLRRRARRQPGHMSARPTQNWVDGHSRLQFVDHSTNGPRARRGPENQRRNDYRLAPPSDRERPRASIVQALGLDLNHMIPSLKQPVIQHPGSDRQ